MIVLLLGALLVFVLVRFPSLRRPVLWLAALTGSGLLALAGFLVVAIPVLVAWGVVTLALLGSHHPNSTAAALIAMDDA